jgi:protein O-GlcNAc transferase
MPSSDTSAPGTAFDLKRAMQEALVLHRAGRLARAESIYHQVIDRNPDNPDALHLMGLIAHQKGEYRVGEKYILRAIAQDNGVAEFYLNLGNAQRDQGKISEAIENYKKTLRLNPNLAEAHYNIANELFTLGDISGAIACYKNAIDLNPDLVEAYYNMGAAFKEQGETDEAFTCYQEAIRRRPAYAEAYNRIGVLLEERGNFDGAIKAYEKAVRLNPEYADAYNNMGLVFRELNKFKEALLCYRKAVHLKRDFAEAYNNMGEMFKREGKLNDAVSCYEKALAIKPGLIGIDVRKRLLLPVICKSKETIEEDRKRLIGQIKLLESKNISLEDPNEQVGATNFFCAYHGLNDLEIQKRLAAFYLKACPDLAWEAKDCYQKRNSHEKIRIGIISFFLRKHTIGKLNLGIIRNLSRERFSVKLFRFPGKEDNLSKELDSSADESVILPSKLREAREKIADHSLDILFYLDVGMTPLTYFLAFSRLAPVQCVTWGHPVTTGIPNMDYFISSENAELPGADDHYSERLIRLKKLPIYYYRPDIPEKQAARGSFGLDDGYNLYVCPQTLFKFHPDFDTALGEILRGDQRGILVLIEGNFNHWTELLVERFNSAFPDVSDRVKFLSRMSEKDFFSLLMLADVVLDPFHFGGGNSSLEAFACGVPVVTLPSPFLRGRLTLALYGQMDVMDCVACDLKSYVNIALRLGNDKNWREEIRAKIKSRSDILFEDVEAVRELEGFFEWAVAKKNQCPLEQG